MTPQSRSLALAATVVGVGVTAFVLGRWSAPESAHEAVEVAHNAPAARAHGHSHGEEPLTPAGDLSEIPPLESEVAQPTSDVPELNAALNLAKQSVSAPDDEHLEEAAAAATGKLEERVLSDPLALQAAIERFGQVTTKAELEILAAVLGRVRDLQVEELALQAARSDALSERRVAALHILDALDSPRATELAIDLLASETNTEIRRAAVFAIPEPLGTSAGNAQQVVATLGRAAQSDPDAELRRRAVIQLGAWHTNTSDLRTVVRLLSSDPSVDVRAGCAFALEVSARRDPAVLSALTVAMNDRGEDALVRENAWRALGRMGPLPESVSRDYETFSRELAHMSGG